MTDEELLVLLSKDKTLERGFRLLVDTYGDRLYQHLRRMMHTHEDTDDVLQNTLVKVYRNIPSFKGNSKLYTWLYRIATNEALTQLSKQKRRVAIAGGTEEEQAYTLANLQAEPVVSGAYIKERLQAAITSLPPKQRAVFSLRYFEEKTYQEMSDMMGTSVGALKANYHHAVKKIEVFLR